MRIKTNRIITLGLALLFIFSFVLPSLRGPLGIELSGFSVFAVNVAAVVFVEDFYDYFLFLYNALTNVWVVLLLIWSVRVKVKTVPTIILSVLAITSSFSWMFKMEQLGVFLVGYYLWVISILLITSFALYRSLKFHG